MRPIRLGGPNTATSPSSFIGKTSYFGDGGENNTNRQQQQQSSKFNGPVVTFQEDYETLENNNNNDDSFSLVVRRGLNANNNNNDRRNGSNNKGILNRRPTSRGGGRRPQQQQQQQVINNRINPLVANDDYNEIDNNNNNNDGPGFSIVPASRSGMNNFQQNYKPLFPAIGGNNNNRGSYYTGETASMLYGSNFDNQNQQQQQQPLDEYQIPQQQIDPLPSNDNNNQILLSQRQQQASSGFPRSSVSQFPSTSRPISPQFQQQQQPQFQQARQQQQMAPLISAPREKTLSVVQPAASALAPPLPLTAAQLQELANSNREILRLRHSLILAHEKLRANNLDAPKPSERTMPSVRGLPLQPLARAFHVGVSRYYEGPLEVLEGIDVSLPLKEASSSLFGGPEWKIRYVVVNEGCVNVYKNEETYRKFAGQGGLKASLMFQFVNAFVPAFGQAGTTTESKWTPSHPMAVDTEKYRYFGFTGASGFLMTFRTDAENTWNVWSHAFGRAINPPLYAQTFPEVVAADPDPVVDDITKLSDEEKKKMAEHKKSDEEEAAARKKRDDEAAALDPEARRIEAMLNALPSAQAEANNTNNNNNNNNPNSSVASPPRPVSPTNTFTSPPPPPPPPQKPPVDVSDMGCDPAFPVLRKDNVAVQVQEEQVETKAIAIQTDAWIPDTSNIIDPVEVENQWATHVEQLHQKYGEHTTKLEHNLQLARAEVAHLSSTIEIMKTQHKLLTASVMNSNTNNNFNNAASASISIPRQDELIGDDEFYALQQQQQQQQQHPQNNNADNLSPISNADPNSIVLPSLGNAAKRSSSNINNNRIRNNNNSSCPDCHRLESELVSVEQERDSLIRELARRHEDYQKGISRLCDQVLDDIDAVHTHVRDKELRMVTKNRYSSSKRGTRNNFSEGEDEIDEERDFEFDVEKKRIKYSKLRQQQEADEQFFAQNYSEHNAAMMGGLSKDEHLILLDQMQQLGKLVPPFLSIQLFDETAISKNNNKKKNSNSNNNNSNAISRIGIRAAFDGRICQVDTVPGRETCTLTAKDSKSGKSLCSLRLKLENGATLASVTSDV